MGRISLDHVTAILVLIALAVRFAAAEEGEAGYRLEYPLAEQFCPPVAGFFDEVQRTMDRVGNRTFHHQPNGGYGLAVVDKIGAANLLHLGADVGWYRIGDPVFAVSNGVVRISEGPPPKPTEETKGKKKQQKEPVELAWGNLVVIEHRLLSKNYVTTIYGHLANERLVKAGDLVRAGQQIGTIGTTRVNGGYKPHLHFGVREGRMMEVGRLLLVVPLEGKMAPLRVAELRADAIVLNGADKLPEVLQMTIGERKFEMRTKNGIAEVPWDILGVIQPPEFPIVGYGLSTEGWHDPIGFLRERGAELAPAPFHLSERTRKRGREVRQDKREDAGAERP
jgi:murein DD-endopeptidase MepM/ murein hydrolase activator NlpD